MFLGSLHVWECRSRTFFASSFWFSHTGGDSSVILSLRAVFLENMKKLYHSLFIKVTNFKLVVEFFNTDDCHIGKGLKCMLAILPERWLGKIQKKSIFTAFPWNLRKVPPESRHKTGFCGKNRLENVTGSQHVEMDQYSTTLSVMSLWMWLTLVRSFCCTSLILLHELVVSCPVV